MTRLREARDPETGQPISETEIRDQALIFLMAGHETTAGALTFTLHLLGRHPEIQDRVAAEIRDVLGDADAPTAEQASELVWTRAALMEGMRLYPSAHTTERCTVEPLVLGGYRLPAQQIVLVSPWTTHRHPGALAGPRAFRPARGSSANTTGPATPTSRSAAARAPASVSISRCSKRSSCWRRCCAADG